MGQTSTDEILSTGEGESGQNHNILSHLLPRRLLPPLPLSSLSLSLSLSPLSLDIALA
ncbi:unnamed protein product [Spirodela intermedia]|uniref:Uncharacterized protein n=1 Tax=Spirodela intermedia TaxID=51605 RepID=A0A7I8JH76_SPIIN|nr:unnamed protein product [Spirodela intermedia]CAA6669496.1 unnamed protein product [Spirodela intermedia]